VQIILYAWALFASTLLLIPVANMGLLYVVVALGSGGWFVFEAYKLYREGISQTVKNPMRLFHWANTYLTVLFIAIAVDPLLPF
jgi:protoheme IX farnesyltransferase